MSNLKKLEKKLLEVKGDGKFSRMGRTFSTKNKTYFYDAGTGKIFGVKESVYRMLTILIETEDVQGMSKIEMTEEEIEEGAADILKTMEKENILQAPDRINMTGRHVEGLEDELKVGRQQITLELTEVCNMRCKYCIYHDGQGGFREFGKKMMDFEVAKLAIDDLMKNSDGGLVHVTFYGGEPLVNYDVLKKSIEYCQEKYGDREIKYAMTTNGTLITSEIAEFLAKVRCVVTVSLDGPKEMNDKYRVFADGRGSYDATMNGLKLLVEAYKKYDVDAPTIGLSMVIPEYTDEDLNEIQKMLDGLESFIKDFPITISYVNNANDEGCEYEGVYNEREQKLRKRVIGEQKYYDPIGTWGLKKFIEEYNSFEDIPLLTRASIIRELDAIQNRRLSDTPIDSHGFNGCCVPGARRVDITNEGKYRVCEKIGKTQYIVDVYNGLDIEKIREMYVNRYKTEAEKYCKDCWAVNMCGKCYVDCYDENKANFKLRHKNCEACRTSLEKRLSLYMSIYENNPEMINELAKNSYI